jgi:hypothetical protein
MAGVPLHRAPRARCDAAIEHASLGGSSVEELTLGRRFQYIGNVETTQALSTLAGLAQETRLAIFRLLVERGLEGMPAGAIADALGSPMPPCPSISRN